MSDNEHQHGETESIQSNDIRQIIAPTTDNQGEIVVASQQYLDQLDPVFLNGLETISATPEAPWDEIGERLLRDWMDEAKKSSLAHQATGYKLKSRYLYTQYLVIVATVLVFVAANMFPCTDQQEYKYIQIGFAAFNLFISSFAAFRNYGETYQSHFEYEGHYIRYATDIEEILVTDRDFRVPKDKTIAELKERKKQLANAPEL